MRQTEFTFVNGREQSLVATEFLPDSSPWATLIWHHGRRGREDLAIV
jgi:hypothetical protein